MKYVSAALCCRAHELLNWLRMIVTSRNGGRLYFAIALLACTSAWSKGLLDDLDYCKAEERDFKDSTSAYEDYAKKSVALLDGWYKDPTTLTPQMMDELRKRVRASTYESWADSDEGRAVIASWRLERSQEVIDKFMQYIFPVLMPHDAEDAVARALFKNDYENSLKQGLANDLQKGRDNLKATGHQLDSGCKADVLSTAIRVSVVGPFLLVSHNFVDARKERGEVAKAYKALTGVSAEAIFENGLRGSEGSEANKLKKNWENALSKAGIGENSVIRQIGRAVDPTHIQGVPKQLQVTLDGKSAKNAVKNLTLGAVH